MAVLRDPLLVQMAERYRQRASSGEIDISPQSVSEWAHRYRVIDGRPFSLERFRPLQALYEDDHDRIAIMKPAQRGVSEYAVSLICYALEYGARRWVPDGSKAGLNVAMVFPAKADLIDFSKERLSDLKDESTHLASMFGSDEFDALGFKKIGDSYLYLRGGYSKAGLRSFPADVLILDEFDELATDAIALARRRMNASLVKREVMISTPSIPGRGISAAYLASDQRVYQTQCPHCKEWTSFDFFRDVRVDDRPYDEWQKWSQVHVESCLTTMHCPVCNEVMEDDARCAIGRWVALQPEVTRTHGYHIPWWPFIFISLAGLAYSAVSPEISEVTQFYHSDLGLPHGLGDGGITAEMLAQLSAGLPNGLPDGPWRDTVMGVDVGSKLHYSVSSIGPGNSEYVRDMGTANTWDEIDHLMLRYQVRQCVVDGEPEWHSSQDFVKRWPGRSVRAYYPTGVSALKGVLYNQKANLTDVQVNRVMALDTVYNTVLHAQELWPRSLTGDEDIIAHMTSSARVKITDEKTGQQTYDWIHIGPDHWGHASAYRMVARRMLPALKNQIPAVGGTRTALVEQAVSGARMIRETGPSRFSVIR